MTRNGGVMRVPVRRAAAGASGAYRVKDSMSAFLIFRLQEFCTLQHPYGIL